MALTELSIAPGEAAAAQVQSPAQPWWRFPIVWLVIGGPLIVVVAAIATAVIAIRGADPVLSRDDLATTGVRADAKQGGAAAEDALTPAIQARNHAATPKP